MEGHICTEDTFFVDAPAFIAECLVCKRHSLLECGWVGIRCTTCKKVVCEENGMPGIVRQRRELMNMSRVEIAKETGYRYSSVKYFENTKCSEAYAAATARLVLQYNV